MTPHNEAMISQILGGQPMPDYLRDLVLEAELAKSKLGGGGILSPDSISVLVAASGYRLRASAAAAQAPVAESSAPPPPAPIAQPELVPLTTETPLPEPPAPPALSPAAPQEGTPVIPPALGRSSAAIATV